jgi:hypothetical protein
MQALLLSHVKGLKASKMIVQCTTVELHHGYVCLQAMLLAIVCCCSMPHASHAGVPRRPERAALETASQTTFPDHVTRPDSPLLLPRLVLKTKARYGPVDNAEWCLERDQ